jgi:hypothetical protein
VRNQVPKPIGDSDAAHRKSLLTAQSAANLTRSCSRFNREPAFSIPQPSRILDNGLARRIGVHGWQQSCSIGTFRQF